jgi:four helix bundle protein
LGLEAGSVEEDRWKNLEVWKKADELALQVYRATQSFPKEELYGLTSQIRRSALSVPTNIVEGYSRRNDKELARFIGISLGSLAETKYLLYFAGRLQYLPGEALTRLTSGYEIVGKLLFKFLESVRDKTPARG